jgi:hypothetical protein
LGNIFHCNSPWLLSRAGQERPPPLRAAHDKWIEKNFTAVPGGWRALSEGKYSTQRIGEWMDAVPAAAQ